MNPTNNHPDCACGNHKILPEGSVCEKCLGVVMNEPQIFEHETRFDEAYFAVSQEVLDEQVRKYEAIFKTK